MAITMAAAWSISLVWRIGGQCRVGRVRAVASSFLGLVT